MRENVVLPLRRRERMANRLIALILLVISPLAFVALVAMAAFRICGVNWTWVKAFPDDEWALLKTLFTGRNL